MDKEFLEIITKKEERNVMIADDPLLLEANIQKHDPTFSLT